ncbi:MAG: hypothetical protein IKW08_05885 [Roseburia sp.]|nr:hypothetical protein [Roseburia sp.]
MEVLALELRKKIDTICVGYHYYKDKKVLEHAEEAASLIQQYCEFFLQGNIFGMEEDEYASLQRFVIDVLSDYLEALQQRDMVLMLDTLDYGLRELINIYIEDAEGTEHE